MQSFLEMFNLYAMQELIQLLEDSSKLFPSSTLTAEQALISIDKLHICLQDIRLNEEASVAKRNGAKSSSISDFVPYFQGPIESTNMSGRNVLHTNFYDRFDQEDLKQLMNTNTCLIGAAKKISRRC